MQKAYFSLLKQWCDELIRLQLHDTGRSEFDGGILCPACKIIHGRCHDAVYPLLYMADATGDGKYLRAAKLLFKWGENVLTDDGSFYNDAQSTWPYITVFSANDLCHALKHHGHLLTAEEKACFEARMARMAEWLHEKLLPEADCVINYNANCAGAMALLGDYFDCDKYRERARCMAHYCLNFFSENGFLFGEGHPQDHLTPRGCRAVDIGYNVEESLAALLRYARLQHDSEVEQAVIRSMRTHLEFMLPDGGWDNSFGTRNFKWSYWGSRTSDGCQGSYGILGAEFPEFAEAARRNLELYITCSHGGLLHGGPHYHAHGEPPCVHHTFCHAAALAAALDSGLEDLPRCAIPADDPAPLRYYPEIDTWKLARGPFRATVTGSDFDYMPGGHASGGTMTLLWHEKTGPVLAAGMTDYSLMEPINMQLSLKKASMGCLAARVELVENGVRYAQMYDFGSVIRAEETDDGLSVDVTASLMDIARNALPRRPVCRLSYRIREDEVIFSGEVPLHIADRAEFVLPLILSDDEQFAFAGASVCRLERAAAAVQVEYSGAQPQVRRIFNFSGGFSALEMRIRPDENGRFRAAIRVEE